MNTNDNIRKGGSSTNPAPLLKNHHRFNSNSNIAKAEIYNASNGIDKRPAALVRRFGDLYSMARLDTLDALDGINELDHLMSSQPSSISSASSTSSNISPSTDGSIRTKTTSEELKNKLLFSVVVVSAPIN